MKFLTFKTPLRISPTIGVSFKFSRAAGNSISLKKHWTTKSTRLDFRPIKQEKPR